MDGGAWKAAVHGVAKSWTRPSDFTFSFHFHSLEKEMAPHSSVLAWRIPGMGEPSGLPSMGSHRVRHDWSNLAAAAAVISIHNLLNKESKKCYFRNSFWPGYVFVGRDSMSIYLNCFLVTQNSWNQRRGFGSYSPKLAFVIQELKARRNEADSSTELTKGCNM